jgi:predicted dehydrogenase
MSDHTMRYVYPWREMVTAARAGDVGDVFFVQGDYIHDMTSYYRVNGANHTPWRVDADHPQNILLGGGIHPIDLMLWAVDARVEEVFMASNKKAAPSFPSDDCYLLTMRFVNGVIGKCFVTCGCSGPRWGAEWERMFECFGTQGTLSGGALHRRDEEPVDLEDTSSANLIGGHGWGGSVPDFLSVLEGRMTNPIPALAGARNVAVCEAAFQAAASDQAQPVARFAE